MKIIKNISKINLLAIFVCIFGCVPDTVYYANEMGGDTFAANDEVFRVNSQNYPVFAILDDRVAPNSNVNKSQGVINPKLLKKYYWEVTHKIKDKYIVFSKDYNYEYCMLMEFNITKRKYKEAQKICDTREPSKLSINGNGHLINTHIYIRKDGSAYGWQYIRNPRRFVFNSDRVSLFRIDDTGDWSGQPWFKCVERCDKLVNMK